MPAISPAWDDWTTKQTGANSAVLYKFDAPNSRLIIEWSNVRRFMADGTGIFGTFQVILKLNTGATAGNIVFNYPDLDAGANPYTLAATMSVGIKAAGAQGGNRLLVSLNAPSAYAGTGKAILFTTADLRPPRILAQNFNYLTGHSASFTFSESVGTSLAPADFLVENLTTLMTVPASALAVAYIGATNSATLTFPGAGPGGVLPDGVYRITIASPGVMDLAGNTLDGDGNGIAGSDYTFNFFVFTADANHDGRVDTIDFNILAANFSRSGTDFSQGNFNYDSKTDTIDFNLLVANFGKTLFAAEIMSLLGGQLLDLRLDVGGNLAGGLLDVLG
jgi:hypothetical protein